MTLTHLAEFSKTLSPAGSETVSSTHPEQTSFRSKCVRIAPVSQDRDINQNVLVYNDGAISATWAIITLFIHSRIIIDCLLCAGL